jgi:hypothetical protein
MLSARGGVSKNMKNPHSVEPRLCIPALIILKENFLLEAAR